MDNESYQSILSDMKNRYRELSGFENIEPDILQRLKYLAQQSADLLTNAQKLKEQIYPKTATGNYFDLHAQTMGISRELEESDDSLRNRLFAISKKD